MGSSNAGGKERRGIWRFLETGKNRGLRGRRAALCAKEKALFSLKESILLYDVTSTYFEGLCLSNPKAKRGYSRDSRPDCKQVVVGLVLDGEGFPKAHEIFAGNRSDIIWTRSRELSLKVRYHRTQSTMISWSKCRPLKSSCAEGGSVIVGRYRHKASFSSLHQNRRLPVL